MKNSYLYIILAAGLLLSPACKKFERLLLVQTISVSSSTKVARGEVIDVAETTVEYGFCWSTSSDPTVANNKLKVGNASSPKSFETTLSALQAGTTYYIRAYVRSDNGTEYGESVKVVVHGTTTTEYYYDDGIADYGWQYNPLYEGWMGNYFPISSAGRIFSIEIYFANFSVSPGSDQLNVEVFDANHNLIGSTASFNQASDNWVAISANINYSGEVYVMVHWNYTQNPTNYLGMDQDGPNAYLDLGYWHDSSGWGKCSSLVTGNQLPGVFLLRIHAEISSGKTVIYDNRSVPETNQVFKMESAGTQAIDLKNRKDD